jgi:hypothetical protein
MNNSLPLWEDITPWICVENERQRVIREYKRNTISSQTRIKEIGKGVWLWSSTIIMFSKLDAPLPGLWELALRAHTDALYFNI